MKGERWRNGSRGGAPASTSAKLGSRCRAVCLGPIKQSLTLWIELTSLAGLWLANVFPSGGRTDSRELGPLRRPRAKHSNFPQGLTFSSGRDTR